MPIFIHTSITYSCQNLKVWGLYLCPSPPPNNPNRKVFHFAGKKPKTTKKTVELLTVKLVDQ